MNKKELTSALAQECGCTQSQAGEFLGAFTDTVTSALKDGHDINIPGFGKFIPKHRPSREVRNPVTKEKMMSKAKTTAQFKPAAQLKDL